MLLSLGACGGEPADSVAAPGVPTAGDARPPISTIAPVPTTRPPTVVERTTTTVTVAQTVTLNATPPTSSAASATVSTTTVAASTTTTVAPTTTDTRLRRRTPGRSALRRSRRTAIARGPAATHCLGYSSVDCGRLEVRPGHRSRSPPLPGVAGLDRRRRCQGQSPWPPWPQQSPSGQRPRRQPPATTND